MGRCLAVLFKLLSQRYVIVHVLLGIVVTFGQVSGRFVQAVKSKICDCSCIINPRRACAARVTVLGLSFCLSVCLSVRHAILAVRATKSITKDTIVLSVRFAAILKRRFS